MRDAPHLVVLSCCPRAQEVERRFGSDVRALAAGECQGWTRAYDGLAYCVLADQLNRRCAAPALVASCGTYMVLPLRGGTWGVYTAAQWLTERRVFRNIHRGAPASFALDGKALSNSRRMLVSTLASPCTALCRPSTCVCLAATRSGMTGGRRGRPNTSDATHLADHAVHAQRDPG